MSRIKNVITVLPKSSIQASLGLDNGKYPFYTSSQVLTKYYNDYLYEGDAITMGTGGQASINYCSSKFATSTDCFNFSTNCCTKYIYYYLYCKLSEINVLGFEGTSLRHLQKDYLLNINIPNLHIDEQIKIANYLDDKCYKIDKVIKDNNKAIELLEEYKKSMVEDILKTYKPSSIKIKYLLEKSKIGIKTGPFGSSLTGKTIELSDYLVYSQANLISNDFNYSRNYISEDTYNELNSYSVSAGDILLSMMGTIGKCKIIPDGIKPGIMDSHIIKVRLDTNKIIPEYFALIYDNDNTNIIYNQLLFNSKGSIMDGLNTSIVKELIFPIIDISNQKEFLKKVEMKRVMLDKIIEYRKQIIEKLEEYKKSLIYEVVTGKKEV